MMSDRDANAMHVQNLLERRHLGETGRAPRGKEVDDDGRALPVGQARLTRPIESGQLQRRGGLCGG